MAPEPKFYESEDGTLTSGEVVCPHCKQLATDSPGEDVGYDDDSSMELECGECGEELIVVVSISVTYETRKKKVEEAG